MEPVYFSGAPMKYEKEPERLYCKGKNHRGVPCKFRAAHKDTQMCGFHHNHTDDDIVAQLKPFKTNGLVECSFPLQENNYKLRAPWLMPFKS